MSSRRAAAPEREDARGPEEKSQMWRTGREGDRKIWWKGQKREAILQNCYKSIKSDLLLSLTPGNSIPGDGSRLSSVWELLPKSKIWTAPHVPDAAVLSSGFGIRLANH